MTGIIGISLGDVTGVGPEVTLKAIAKELSTDAARYLLIGDADLIQRTNAKLGLNLSIATLGKASDNARVLVTNPLSTALPENLPQGSAPAANAAVAWLKDGAQRCLRK